MPSEPNPDSPATVWAGKHDAQALADATGASWIAPLFALSSPRVVNIADLCGSPAPSQPMFTTTDLINSLPGGSDPEATKAKLQAGVDRVLWGTYCHATDAAPPPAFLPNPLPSDAPAGSPDMPEINYLPEIWNFTKFLAEHKVTRSYHPGDWIDASGDNGTGFLPFEEGMWPVWPAGVELSMTTAPVYQPHDDSEDTGIWWELGWISLTNFNRRMPPVRVQRKEWVLYGEQMNIIGIHWNFALGVEFRVRPLYPDTPLMPGG